MPLQNVDDLSISTTHFINPSLATYHVHTNLEDLVMTSETLTWFRI